jgi:hypothetical protein
MDPHSRPSMGQILGLVMFFYFLMGAVLVGIGWWIFG